MPHVNKKTISEKWKFNSNKKLGLEWAVNGLGKPIRKKFDIKNRKNSKNQSEIAACEQKTTTEKPNFCSNTIFALFKIRAKKIHAAKPLAFALHFLFRRDQNHYSNLTSKIMKMCEQISKKKTAPQYNSNSLNCNKKGLLQYSSSSRNKKRQRPNTIQILWIVKKNRSAIIAGWEDEGGY